MSAGKIDARERFAVVRVSPTGERHALRVLVQDQTWCPNAEEVAATEAARVKRGLQPGWTVEVKRYRNSF